MTVTEFEQMEADLLFPHIPEQGLLALDVGANRGYWSHELASRFDDVHAYEPQIGITDAPDNVTVFNFAVGARVELAEIRLFSNSEHATMVERPDVGYGPQQGTVLRPVVTLDHRYPGGVDFIKIDVEGAEVLVLQGARKLLAMFRPALLVEIHSRLAREQVLGLLAGYDVTVIPNPVAPTSPDYCWIHAH